MALTVKNYALNLLHSRQEDACVTHLCTRSNCFSNAKVSHWVCELIHASPNLHTSTWPQLTWNGIISTINAGNSRNKNFRPLKLGYDLGSPSLQATNCRCATWVWSENPSMSQLQTHTHGMSCRCECNEVHTGVWAPAHCANSAPSCIEPADVAAIAQDGMYGAIRTAVCHSHCKMHLFSIQVHTGSQHAKFSRSVMDEILYQCLWCILLATSVTVTFWCWQALIHNLERNSCAIVCIVAHSQYLTTKHSKFFAFMESRMGK